MVRALEPGVVTQTRDRGDRIGGQPGLELPRTTPAVYDRVAWRDAGIAWLVQRLVFFSLTYLVLWRFTPRPAAAPYPTWGQLLHVWDTWDGANYAAIAVDGYRHLWQAAYFPLFPLLERLLMPLTGQNPALAGLLIANVSCLGAFALLRVLAEREYGRAVARRTLLYVAIFPYSLFLAAAYTEALFLLLCLATFLAFRQRHWWLAGLFAALATLTRPVGILLLVPLLYECGQAVAQRPGWGRLRQMRGELFALALPILALAGFNLALAPRFGTLTSSTAAQVSGWGRRLSWPWDGFLRVGAAMPYVSLGFQIHAALDIFMTALLVGLALAAMWRWSQSLPLSYALYAAATATLVLLTPMNVMYHQWESLVSNGRFLLVVFPLFMLLALWGSRYRWVNRLIFSASLLLCLCLVVAFVEGVFVA